MKRFIIDHGLLHQTTCPYTPQQNGVAERKNRTLLEITRALMIESHVPVHFWPEAIATATYLTNRLPTKPLNYDTPLDILETHVPIPSSHSLPPRVFGCIVYVHLQKGVRTKLEPRAVKCVFLGYGVNQKGYRCYDPIQDKIYTTLDCEFFEQSYYYTQLSPQGESLSDDLSWLTYPEVMNPDPITQVGNTTDVAPETSVSPRLTTPVPSDEHPSDDLSTAEVDSENPGTDTITETNTTTETNTIPSCSVPNRYQLPPRSTRGVPPRRYDPEYEAQRSKYPIERISNENLSSTAMAFTASLYSTDIPKTVEEALGNEKWKQAMEDEYSALQRNKTWEKCILPKGKKKVGCRWVFSIKYRADGTVERYKARLVAKGYTQTYGIDYSETFSPVAKIDTIRVLLSIAANKEWPIYQFDVKNAFLHGSIEEDIYMEAPPGYSQEFRNGEGCKLRKALYGLKQSPRAWFGRFTKAMKKFGYKQSNSDHTLFLKRVRDKITCLIIYVDDMIITGNDEKEITDLKGKLFQEFEMKDLEILKYFLGIEVLRSEQGIFIHQRKYILDLLTETGMLDCKPAETPIVANHGLQILEGAKLAKREQYQKIVGKLIYLAHTRPDIAYAVGVVSRYMHLPQIQHMTAVMRILRYLKGTSSTGIYFVKNDHLDLIAYTDADWAGDRDDRKSTSGYFTLVGGNLVTWGSKKQKVVALSSAEAEFRGIAKGITEILWIQKLMNELGFPQKTACKLFCDNKAAISISENPVQHDRTKHVEIDRHFIKDKLEDKTIKLLFVRSKDQLADILTKAINTKAFEEILRKLGIGAPTVQLEGECRK